MAIRFDAADDRVYVAATFPDPTAGGLTILGWWRVRVDRDDYSAYYRTSTGGSTIHTVETQSTGLSVNIFTAAGEITDTYVNTVDEWVGIAVVDNGSGTVTQYVGPLGGATVSASGSIATGTPDQLCIAGRSQSDATEWFNGAAAHVRVFADTLTQSEIEAEWASPTPVLTAWADWPLSADLQDTAGSDRHLTAVAGSPAFEAGPLDGGGGDTTTNAVWTR
ncbi:MAG: LamG-like jellyroll fold domain-containing protein, partial [Stackebrandtia sp.]